jgi:hypothetical protein
MTFSGAKTKKDSEHLYRAEKEPPRVVYTRLSRSPPGQLWSAGYPCTGAGSLTSMSPLAAPDPAVTRPADFARYFLASRKILGTGIHTTIRIANIFQDL